VLYYPAAQHPRRFASLCEAKRSSGGWTGRDVAQQQKGTPGFSTGGLHKDKKAAKEKRLDRLIKASWLVFGFSILMMILILVPQTSGYVFSVLKWLIHFIAPAGGIMLMKGDLRKIDTPKRGPDDTAESVPPREGAFLVETLDKPLPDSGQRAGVARRPGERMMPNFEQVARMTPLRTSAERSEAEPPLDSGNSYRADFSDYMKLKEKIREMLDQQINKNGLSGLFDEKLLI